MRLKLFLILGLVLGWMSCLAATIKEIRTSSQGQLAGLIDESFYTVDSLIVYGPINDKDMTVLKSLTQKGSLTGLNLKNSTLWNAGDYWFTNDPDTPDSLQVKLKYIYLPDDCTNIPDFAFANVKSLVGIFKDHSNDGYFYFTFETGCLMGTGIKTIDFGAPWLTFCPYSLQDAVELETIKEIGHTSEMFEGAFYNTPKLRGSIAFESLPWIGDRAFSHSSLDEIILPKVEDSFGEAWFEFAKAKRIAITLDGIKVIPSRAFFGCQNLKSLILPSTIDTLKSNCLNHTGLETLTLPEGLRYIESDAMGWNIYLREIVFPSTLQCIGYDNGQYWRSLEKIYVKAQNPPECILRGGGTGLFYAFTGANEYATLYVPKGTLEAYRNAPGWNYFSKIEEFDFSDMNQLKALPANRPIVSSGKGFIYLESPYPTPFSVFDLDGHTIQSGHVEETHEVSLSAGFYLIQLGDETHKVFVK